MTGSIITACTLSETGKLCTDHQPGRAPGCAWANDMRPKAFPKIAPAAGWTGEYVKRGPRRADRTVCTYRYQRRRGPSELALMLRRFRALLWSVDDNPKSADVRETLCRIAAMTPDEAAACWTDLDDTTEAEIERAQWEVLGRIGPPLAIALPELARHALDTMAPNQGGRPPVAGLAVMLAAALAAHWWRLTGTPPTVRIVDFKPTRFMAWAKLMFKRTGYPTGDLYKHLRDGLRAARADERVPPR